MSDLALLGLVMLRARGARGRAVAVAAGVATGVLLVSMLLGAFFGLVLRAERSSWSDPDLLRLSSGGSSPARPTANQMLLRATTEWFDGRQITRVEVAAPADGTATIPGLSTLPVLGQSSLSPALQQLVDSTPRQQLGDRYGRLASEIGAAGLPGPDSLVAITRVPVAALTTADGTVLSTRSVPHVNAGLAASNYGIVAVLGLVALLLPVILLLTVVVRLGARDREERFAAVRMIGATPGRMARLAALETGLVAVLGASLGTLLAWLAIPIEAAVRIDGSTFFPSDLQISFASRATVVAVIVVGAATAAGVRIFTDPIGPLGGSRQRIERRPHLLTLLPLLVGLVMVVLVAAAALAAHADPVLAAGDARIAVGPPVLVLGVVLIGIGILTAAPTIVARVATAAARQTGRAGAVLALNTVRLHPRASVRATSGVVLGVYLISLFAGAASSATATSVTVTGPQYLPADTLIADVDPTRQLTAQAEAALQTRLDRIRGVRDVMLAWADPTDGLIFRSTTLATAGLPASSTEFTHVGNGADQNAPFVTAPTSIHSTRSLQLAAVWVVNDGATVTIEAARTALIASTPLLTPPATRSEQNQNALLSLFNRWADLANLATLLIAALSAVTLAAATSIGILDRRRTLTALGLIGMPRQVIRDAIAVETLLPLAVVIIGSAAVGLLAAWAVLTGLTGGSRTLAAPAATYWLTIAGTTAAAAAAVLLALPVAYRATQSTRLRTV